MIGAATHSCQANPFSLPMFQGGEVEYVISLYPNASTTLRYGVSTGDLPRGVSRGFRFASTSTENTVPSEVVLYLKSTDDAQIGSFKSTLFFALDIGAGPEEAKCLFSVVIKPGTTTIAALSATTTSPTVSTTSASVNNPSLGGVFIQDVADLPLPNEQPPEGFLESIGELGEKNAATHGGDLGNADSNEQHSMNKAVEFLRSLWRGLRGEDVAALQMILTNLMLFPDSIQPTGFFGPITEKAVREFQREHGLPQVGIFGPRTRPLFDDSALQP